MMLFTELVTLTGLLSCLKVFNAPSPVVYYIFLVKKSVPVRAIVFKAAQCPLNIISECHWVLWTFESKILTQSSNENFLLIINSFLSDIVNNGEKLPTVCQVKSIFQNQIYKIIFLWHLKLYLNQNFKLLKRNKTNLNIMNLFSIAKPKLNLFI